jgi:hypothetical protein
MAKKLLVEVQIDEDINRKYPNFNINYSDNRDFFINNIVAGFNHYKDEQECDFGYEHFVANELIDSKDLFVDIGDKVAFYDKKQIIATVEKIVDHENCEISFKLDNGEINTKKVLIDELVTVYDLLEAI